MAWGDILSAMNAAYPQPLPTNQDELLRDRARQQALPPPQPQGPQLPQPIIHDAGVDPLPLLGYNQNQVVGSQMPGGPPPMAGPSSSSTGIAMAGAGASNLPGVFIPPTAPTPQTNFMTDSSIRAMNPGMAGQLSAVPPDQWEALNKRFQAADQDVINRSFGQGATETGVQGVRDLNFYLNQLTGGGRAGFSPQERAAALQMQTGDVTNRMALQKSMDEMSAKKALAEMELAGRERLGEQQARSALDVAKLQFGDTADRKQDDAIAKQILSQDIRSGVPQQEALAKYQKTLEAMTAMRTPGRAALPGISGPGMRPDDALRTFEALRKSENPQTKQIDLPTLLQQTRGMSGQQREALTAELRKRGDFDKINKDLYDKMATSMYKLRDSVPDVGGWSTESIGRLPGFRYALKGPGGVRYEFSPPLGTLSGFKTGEHTQTAGDIAAILAAMNAAKR